jgi:hypothetical protein
MKISISNRRQFSVVLCRHNCLISIQSEREHVPLHLHHQPITTNTMIYFTTKRLQCHTVSSNCKFEGPLTSISSRLIDKLRCERICETICLKKRCNMNKFVVSVCKKYDENVIYVCFWIGYTTTNQCNILISFQKRM